MKWIFYNFFPIILVGIAAAMIFTGKPNWGWFLAAALCVAVMPSSEKPKE